MALEAEWSGRTELVVVAAVDGVVVNGFTEVVVVVGRADVAVVEAARVAEFAASSAHPSVSGAATATAASPGSRSTARR